MPHWHIKVKSIPFFSINNIPETNVAVTQCACRRRACERRLLNVRDSMLLWRTGAFPYKIQGQKDIVDYAVGLLSRTWVTKVFFCITFIFFSDVELAVDSCFSLLTSNTVIRNLKLQYFVCDNVL